jgi:hypothetical protein
MSSFLHAAQPGTAEPIAEHSMGLSSIVCTISLAIGAPGVGKQNPYQGVRGLLTLFSLFVEMNSFFHVIYVKGIPLKIETG